MKNFKDSKIESMGTSLAVQWLRLCTYTLGVVGSIPGRGTKIPHAQKVKKKNHQNYNVYNETK